METQTLTIELAATDATRLLARLITYVAGRGLAIERVDFAVADACTTLLVRVAGLRSRLDPLPAQLSRCPGVVHVTAPPSLRRCATDGSVAQRPSESGNVAARGPAELVRS